MIATNYEIAVIVRCTTSSSVKRLKLYPSCADGDVIPDSDYYIIDHIVDRRERVDGVFEYRVRYNECGEPLIYKRVCVEMK